MLDRDVVQVDMRLGQRPTLRMSQAALESWWQIKQLTTGEQ
jgi:cell division protein FtsQ